MARDSLSRPCRARDEPGAPNARRTRERPQLRQPHAWQRRVRRAAAPSLAACVPAGRFEFTRMVARYHKILSAARGRCADELVVKKRASLSQGRDRPACDAANSIHEPRAVSSLTPCPLPRGEGESVRWRGSWVGQGEWRHCETSLPTFSGAEKGLKTLHRITA